MKKEKNKDEKKKNQKGRVKSESRDFDNGVHHEFKVDVKLGPGKIETIGFTVEPKKSECLTYDEVEFAALDRKEVEYPESYYPKAELHGGIFIKNECGKWCPVLSESDKDGIGKVKKSKEYDMFLVLPDALYSLVPEYALYLKMVEEGAIDPDKFKYDFDRMHEMVEYANLGNTGKTEDGKSRKHK